MVLREARGPADHRSRDAARGRARTSTSCSPAYEVETQTGDLRRHDQSARQLDLDRLRRAGVRHRHRAAARAGVRVRRRRSCRKAPRRRTLLLVLLLLPSMARRADRRFRAQRAAASSSKADIMCTCGGCRAPMNNCPMGAACHGLKDQSAKLDKYAGSGDEPRTGPGRVRRRLRRRRTCWRRRSTKGFNRLAWALPVRRRRQRRGAGRAGRLALDQAAGRAAADARCHRRPRRTRCARGWTMSSETSTESRRRPGLPGLALLRPRVAHRRDGRRRHGAAERAREPDPHQPDDRRGRRRRRCASTGCWRRWWRRTATRSPAAERADARSTSSARRR